MRNIKSIKHLCFECLACEQVCPKAAITMEENFEGFSYPKVDINRCVDCGLCLKVCPAINSHECKNAIGSVYAVQLEDKRTLKKSSSGGVFSLIAEHIIALGGVVFGAAWDQYLHLRHVCIETLDELNQLRGSKYVHSDVGDTYIQARDYLIKGRLVYYTGTPCQIAGLRLFLRKEYSNLITSDLVCHGTPSQKIFNLFVEAMENDHNAKLLDYKFRDKKIFGWSCSSSSFSINNDTGKKKYHFYDKNMTAYFQAFIKGHITREDCYKCSFACPQRVGDITLADYWDVSNHHPEFPNQRDGVSLIIINTQKGKDIFENIKEKVFHQCSTIDKALNTSNHNLKAPTPRPFERDKAYQEAFNNFKSFRDKYAAMAPPESYYKNVYRNYCIKSLPVIRLLMNILGKNEES